MHKVKRKSLCGSFTVEAALIMPIVLAVIFALLYMSFYMHDMCTIRSIADRNLSEICHIKQSGAPLSFDVYGEENWLQNHLSMLGVHYSDKEKVVIEEGLKKEMEEQLFLFVVDQCEVNELLQKVTLTVNINADIPLPFVKPFLPNTNIKVNSYAAIYDPTVSVRYGRMLYTEFARSKAYEKVQTLLEKAREYLE